MSRRRAHSSAALAFQAAELAFAVPQVVAHRMTRMAIAGPVLSKRDANEFNRMSTEKAAAFSESWSAMTMHTLQTNQALATSMLRSVFSPSPNAIPSAMAIMHGAALGIFGKGLAPLHRTATANARRLARTKLR